ncbi:MAG: phosphoglycerate dehydrogenase [Pseudomonadota bacterium]
MTHALSMPKEQIRILLLEGIAETAVEALSNAGYKNVERLTTALSPDELKEALTDVRILGIRSRTKLTADIFHAAKRLIAVGSFSVGTNQIDLKTAHQAGIPVFNAPFSNTRSVAELTIAEIVMLFRRVFPRSTAAHNSGWDKSASGSYEIRGKTLGIIGYGNIGTQLAILAEAMGMRVLYHDHVDKLRHGNAEPAKNLHDLLSRSDVVSLHLPETEQTKNIMGEQEIRAMKPGSYLINNARGTIVDIDALVAALKDNHLAGAAIDVFPVEPASNALPFESPLRGCDNVILTPHVGGSTQEAQQRIGEEVARKLIEYSDVGSTVGAVNFPNVQLPLAPTAKRFIQIHKNLPGVMQKVNDVFARRDINIISQYLLTDPEIGYVVIDVEGEVENANEILTEIRGFEETLRARQLNGPN